MGPSSSGDPQVNGRRKDPADADDANDSGQNNRPFLPADAVNRQLKLDADASAPNKVDHGQFAVVDVPALDCGDANDRQHLGQNPDQQRH